MFDMDEYRSLSPTVLLDSSSQEPRTPPMGRANANVNGAMFYPSPRSDSPFATQPPSIEMRADSPIAMPARSLSVPVIPTNAQIRDPHEQFAMSSSLSSSFRPGSSGKQ